MTIKNSRRGSFRWFVPSKIIKMGVIESKSTIPKNEIENLKLNWQFFIYFFFFFEFENGIILKKRNQKIKKNK